MADYYATWFMLGLPLLVAAFLYLTVRKEY